MADSRGFHVNLSHDAQDALAILMARTGLGRTQALNYAVINLARGHDGYYMQMAAYQSAIAASAALFAAQKLCKTSEERKELVGFALDLAESIHGPPPSAPDHLANRAAHTTIGKAFFDALASHYGPAE